MKPKDERNLTEVIRRQEQTTYGFPASYKMKRLPAATKAMVASFIHEDKLSSYPTSDDDLHDENLWRDELGMPAATGMIKNDLVEEIGRTCERCKLPPPYRVDQFADLLLKRWDETYLCTLQHLPPWAVEVDRVLAHLESLGLDLPPRMAASIARRTTILLLNTRARGGVAGYETPSEYAPAIPVELSPGAPPPVELADRAPPARPGSSEPQPPRPPQPRFVGTVRIVCNLEFNDDDGKSLVLTTGTVLDSLAPTDYEKKAGTRPGSEYADGLRWVVVFWEGKRRMLPSSAVQPATS